MKGQTNKDFSESKVNIETAMKLKTLGFSEKVKNGYKIKESTTLDFVKSKEPKNYNLGDAVVSAPTKIELVNWIDREYRLYPQISIMLCLHEAQYELIIKNRTDLGDKRIDTSGGFKSASDALDAFFNYALS